MISRMSHLTVEPYAVAMDMPEPAEQPCKDPCCSSVQAGDASNTSQNGRLHTIQRHSTLASP
jgi:hypothetical protein